MPRKPHLGTVRIALALIVWLGPGIAPLAASGWWKSGAARAATCPTVPNTPSFTFAYGPVQLYGSAAAVGTVVEALSPRGDLAGCFEVETSGAYGAMHIYGEDTSASPAIPGMRDGETVVFRVDGVPAGATPELIWHDDRDLHQIDLDAQATLPLEAPTNLGAAASSQTEIGLTWQDNSGDESAFSVERSEDCGITWTPRGSTGAEATSYSDQGLACETAFHYRVRAYRDSDGS